MPRSTRRSNVAVVVAGVGGVAVVNENSVQPIPDRRSLGKRHVRPQIQSLRETDVPRYLAAVSPVPDVEKRQPLWCGIYHQLQVHGADESPNVLDAGHPQGNPPEISHTIPAFVMLCSLSYEQDTYDGF